MRKYLLILSVLILLVGCEKEKEVEVNTTLQTPKETALSTEIPSPIVWRNLSNNVKSMENDKKIILSVFDDEIAISCPAALPVQLELEVIDLEEIIRIRLMYYYDGMNSEGNFLEHETITITQEDYGEEALGKVGDWFIYDNLMNESLAKLELNSKAFEDYKHFLQKNPNPFFKLIG